MERLTVRDAIGGEAMWAQNENGGGPYRPSGHPIERARLDRLADYEDTRLLPEQIAAISDRYTAKKIKVETEPDREYIDFICPRCGDIISQSYKKKSLETLYKCNFHDECGQRTDWSHIKEDVEAILAKEESDG